ncbi:prepilin-type N-terminal cleavage/methylation domain-containing protein [Shewanella gelidimarina]|uniref:prepilin-type N-terminal cleavage/methylation domain-containing protein n=1 Tax=Shewanella gelidimarina TaxID=56813 RepID=UPI0024B05813|nr:prepilin-type N-terminal cleavage/methylation domain-containing protein [Shewanella gelidimarina]
MNKSKGFTLIELVIVIIIIGILSVMAAPRFLNLSSDAKKATLTTFAGAYKSAETMSAMKANLDGVNPYTKNVVTTSDKLVDMAYGSIVPTYANVSKALEFDGIIFTSFKPTLGYEVRVYPAGTDIKSGDIPDTATFNSTTIDD